MNYPYNDDGFGANANQDSSRYKEMIKLTKEV
jgi:hypothetical protein